MQEQCRQCHHLPIFFFSSDLSQSETRTQRNLMVRWAGLSRAVGTWLDRSEVRIERQELRLPVVSSWVAHRWLLECANFLSTIKYFTLFVPYNCPHKIALYWPILPQISSLKLGHASLMNRNVPMFHSQQSSVSLPFLPHIAEEGFISEK